VIYAATTDARLVCLDRATGEPCAGFGTSGEVGLRAGLRHAPEYSGEYSVSSPRAIYKDVVITGSFVADNSRAKMASGEVRAFAAKTGALRWTFHPLPANSPAGAPNTWSRITIDDTNGLVFLPTGSASPDYYGGLPRRQSRRRFDRCLEGRNRRNGLEVSNGSSRHLGL
jgi:quinoprotein glucose dehydrogenase